MANDERNSRNKTYTHGADVLRHVLEYAGGIMLPVALISGVLAPTVASAADTEPVQMAAAQTDEEPLSAAEVEAENIRVYYFEGVKVIVTVLANGNYKFEFIAREFATDFKITVKDGKKTVQSDPPPMSYEPGETFASYTTSSSSILAEYEVALVGGDRVGNGFKRLSGATEEVFLPFVKD